MKNIKFLLLPTILISSLVAICVLVWNFKSPISNTQSLMPGSRFGNFLAANHAIFINDFETAAGFLENAPDQDIGIVKNTATLAGFLAGALPADANISKDSINTDAARMIRDAYLLQDGDWAAIYAAHNRDESVLAAPLRIWSGIATNHITKTFEFINKLQTSDSWKSFVRGQIYAETGKPLKAAENFAKVPTNFMNINDFMYITAFYRAHDMDSAADKLFTDFTSTPGGMFVLDIETMPKWPEFSGFNNALAFGMIQNVSHTAAIMYSDLSLLFLRFASISMGESNAMRNALDYYLGIYFFNNGGDYKKYFNNIDLAGPYRPFGDIKIAEKTGNISELEAASRRNPLFVPATTKLVAKYVQNDRRGRALAVLDRALDNPNLTDLGRAFFLKHRATVNFTFNDMDAAQSDISHAADILPNDIGILGMQSKIWAAQKKRLDSAYDYAMAIVRAAPADLESWDILGRAVAAREGATAALELLERVGAVANECSSLFEQLGDLYTQTGDIRRASDSYARALDLSDDGLTVAPNLEKKIKKLKGK